ncbi:phage baseplate assembly protein V [Pseudoalteromonas xiamenensis]
MLANEHQSGLAMSDLQHRLSKLITIGKVAEVDYEKALVRVKLGAWTTAWLPWLHAQANNDITWQAPEVDEQVVVLAPGGDTAQGVVLGSLYQQNFGVAQTDVPVEKREHVQRVKYQDGSIIEYDRESHRYLIDIKGADATVDIISAGTLNILTEKDIRVETKANAKVFATANAEVTVDGNAAVKVAGDVTVDGATIKLNGGSPCVTTAHICHFTGSPHGDGSSTVSAGK